MKNNMILKSLMIFIVLLSGCNKDDDNTDADCVKDNYFKAEFDGGVIEPRWITSLSFKVYTLYVNRNKQDENNWGIVSFP